MNKEIDENEQIDQSNLLLSIIVPVYNVKDYLNICLQSLINQDLSPDLYEIITINDGSTDNSLKVLEDIQNKTNRIKIVSQENQGLSGARNTGIDIAQGKYILFVDSDDTLLSHSLKNLIKIMSLNNLDILEFGASGITETGKITYTASINSNNKVLTGENYLATITYMNSACNKVYRRDFINANSLRFLPKVYIEDIEFNTRAVFLCKKIMAIDIVYAHFLQREGSITRTKNFNKSKKMIYDILTVLNSINDIAEKRVTKKSKAYKPLKERVSSLVATMLLRVLKETRDYDIKKNIIYKLKEADLYPTKYKAQTGSKRLFLKFANNSTMFSLACKLMTYINKIK
ncbi:glycosyltransferase [Algibacter sp. Ld11]|uniref:glycosyltransferase n=1 Tax=Algibacter sp. Ld11 TaxID=649150 RepID=UPI0038657499